MLYRYIPELEKHINILSNEVSAIIDYRKGRKSFLKRTFVSASDASRSKCLKTDLDIPRNTVLNKGSIVTPPIKSLASHSLSNLSEANFKLIDKVRSQNGIRGKLVIYIHHNDSSPFHVVSQAALKAKLSFDMQRTGNMKTNEW